MDKQMDIIEKVHEYCKLKAQFYTNIRDERAEAYRDVFNFIYEQVKEALNDN